MEIRINRNNDSLLEEIAADHLPTLGIPARADADSVTFDVDDAPDSGEAGDVLASLLGDQRGGPWTVDLSDHCANDDGTGLEDGDYRVFGCAGSVLYLYPTARDGEAVDALGVDNLAEYEGTPDGSPPPEIGDCARIDLCEDSGTIYLGG